MNDHLPAEVSSFVGRVPELRASRELFASSRLVTLTGCGGIGKTRLALRMAREVMHLFPDGVWFVDLAEIPATATEELVEQTVAQSVGLMDFSDRVARSALIDHLRGRRCLLVLDNCEHLVGHVGALVSRMLQGVDRLQVLATSREPLRCAGEHIVSVQPLAVDSSVVRSDAVELLRQRAVAVGAPVDDDDLRAAAELCRRLDGLPLAIELAASRLGVLTVYELLTRLDDRFRLLAGGVTRDDSRHRTLREVMSWSLQLCTAAQRLMWARISVFPAGFDLDAAENICSGDGIAPTDVLELLAGLVDQSLLIAEREGLATRYRQLDTVREYGRSLMSEPGQAEVYRVRHQEYFQETAARASHEWFGARQRYWVGWASANMQNLRAAMECALHGPRPDGALEIAVHLNTMRLWFFTGWPSEGRAWLERALAALPGTAHPLRCKALALVGVVALLQRDMVSVRALIEECRTAARHLPQQYDLRFLEGLHAMFAGDPRAVTVLGDLRSSDIAGGDRVTVSHNWALAAAGLADPETALSVTSRHLENTMVSEAPWHIAWAHLASAIAQMRNDQHELALASVRNSIRGHSHTGDLWAALTGVLATARILAAGLPRGSTPTVGADRDSAGTVAELLGGVTRMLGWFGVPSTEEEGGQVGVYLAEATRTARGILGDQAFQRNFDAGAHMNASRVEATERIMATALGDQAAAADRSRRELSDGGTGQLTEREQEIAGIVAQGWTNRQIAEKLVLSIRTVQTHVANIMRKLGMHNRSELVLWWGRNQRSSTAVGPEGPSSATAYGALKA